jgi:hypothetical protein
MYSDELVWEKFICVQFGVKVISIALMIAWVDASLLHEKYNSQNETCVSSQYENKIYKLKLWIFSEL